MKSNKNLFSNLLILAVLAIGVHIRANWYGDLRLSIANAETASYISASRHSIFSWGIFAGQRLFTTNLIYKLANHPERCRITSYGKPGIGEEDDREIQPCFDKIALLQNILALFGWCFLGWMAARQVQNPLVKALGAASIMLFGFTPQIAEWDSVLSPESLSLSMFAIVLGLMLEVVFRAASSDIPFKSGREKTLLAILVMWYVFWIFVRDVHLYAIPITIILLLLLFLSKQFRVASLYVTVGVLFFFLMIGYASARDSLRATRYPLMNSLDAFIWPYPARVEFFRTYGMPDKEAPSYFDSPNYQAWADEHAAGAYAMFLISHPGFIITTLWEDWDTLNADFAQPYFFTDEVIHRDLLLKIGEMVNPESGVVYLITTALALTLMAHAAQTRSPQHTAWAWLAVWMYGIAAATLFLSYFGDTAGLRRHIMPSVELFRLFLWIFLLPFLDRNVSQKTIKE
ncbi:MAG: hypothetical protein HXY38_02785 [Chloroflexi bacterium]|nr:hypothetical protein [Chloroflexota bacterium]